MEVNKIPNEFFISKGFGVDNYELHAGAFHLALCEAGIDGYNIQTYSSVLPATAKLVTLDEIDLPVHGSEMKCIQACMYGEFGQHISAGIAYAWLYEDEDFTKKYGGLVTEVKGHYTTEILEERLYMVINNLFDRTYKDKGLYMGEPCVITQGGDIPNDVRYGAALVSMNFINYL